MQFGELHATCAVEAATPGPAWSGSCSGLHTLRSPRHQQGAGRQGRHEGLRHHTAAESSASCIFASVCTPVVAEPRIRSEGNPLTTPTAMMLPRCRGGTSAALSGGQPHVACHSKL